MSLPSIHVGSGRTESATTCITNVDYLYGADGLLPFYLLQVKHKPHNLQKTCSIYSKRTS
jgi:hypothetical protein